MALSSQLMKQAGEELQSALEQIRFLQDQIVIVDNRNKDDGALVTGCLVGSLAGIMCCTIL